MTRGDPWWQVRVPGELGGSKFKFRLVSGEELFVLVSLLFSRFFDGFPVDERVSALLFNYYCRIGRRALCL